MVQFSIEELLCKYGINIWRLKESLNKKSFFSCNLVFQDISLSLSFANKAAVDNFISILIYFVVRMVINFLALSMTRRCLSNQGFLWCLYTYWHILITVINRLYPGKDCPFSLSLFGMLWKARVVCNDQRMFIRKRVSTWDDWNWNARGL